MNRPQDIVDSPERLRWLMNMARKALRPIEPPQHFELSVFCGYDEKDGRAWFEAIPRHVLANCVFDSNVVEVDGKELFGRTEMDVFHVLRDKWEELRQMPWRLNTWRLESHVRRDLAKVIAYSTDILIRRPAMV